MTESLIDLSPVVVMLSRPSPHRSLYRAARFVVDEVSTEGLNTEDGHEFGFTFCRCHSMCPKQVLKRSSPARAPACMSRML